MHGSFRTTFLAPLASDISCTRSRRTLAEVDYGFSEEADTVPPTPTKEMASARTSALGGEAAMFAKLKAEALDLASNVASMFTPASEMPTIAGSGAAASEKSAAAVVVEFDETLGKQPSGRSVTNAAGISER